MTVFFPHTHPHPPPHPPPLTRAVGGPRRQRPAVPAPGPGPRAAVRSAGTGRRPSGGTVLLFLLLGDYFPQTGEAPAWHPRGRLQATPGRGSLPPSGRER